MPYPPLPEIAGCPACAGHDGRDIIPCCSSSGSAIPARATSATATTSASWRSRRSPSATTSAPWRRRFQGVAAEGPIGSRARAAAAARHLHERVRPRGGGGRAFLQARPRRHRRVPRRDRSRARQGAGEDRRRRSPATTGCARSRRMSATTIAACASASVIPASRNWCTPTCSTISPRASGRGSRRCATSSPTMPSCWRRARTRASRTRFISPCGARASSRQGAGRADGCRAEGAERQSKRDLMGFKCGIVGLPNVGKSTLFNALTETAAAQAANYPFCTIEPNVGEVAVPDPRLDTLAKLAKSAKIMPTRLTFVDIAGPGARRLARARGSATSSSPISARSTPSRMWCAASRTTTSPMSTGKIDPIADIETIETELMLADLDSLEKRVDNAGEEGQGQRQGSEGGEGDARSRQPRAGAAARRQAGAAGRAQAGGGEGRSACSAC